MADPAHDLFEEFRLGQMARIDRCLNEREAETQVLDFKRNNDNTGPIGTLEREGRQVLAKALSAFANAGGGVLVWGIEDKGDRAHKGHPIPNVEDFVTQLRKFTPSLVNPPLDGVKHEAIPDPTRNGAGYAVTYIPDGKVKPHMATATTETWTYFLRSGESSKAMPDAAVRAFVMAGARPSLTLKTEFKTLEATIGLRGLPSIPAIPEGLRAVLKIIVINDGTALAESPAVAIENSGGYLLANLRDESDSSIEFEGVTYAVKLYRMSYADPIYPGTSIRHGHVEFFLPVKRFEEGYRPAEDFTIRYWVFARNFSETKLIVVPKESLIVS